jgi:hypothetical protein
MSQLRSVPQAKINFLFFQDIITSVMGILILITLMLSLSLNTGDTTNPEENRLQNELDQARQQLTRLENENRATQQARLAAAALPDRALLERQVETLRADQTISEQARLQSEAARRQSENASLTNRAATAALQELITNLSQKISGLREEIARSKTNSNVIYLTPDANMRQAARQPVVFLVSSDKIEERKFNGGHGAERALNDGVEPVRSLLAGLDSSRDYVVFFLRPSGVKWFAPLRDLARKAGFEVGYDAIEEQQELIFGAP